MKGNREARFFLISSLIFLSGVLASLIIGPYRVDGKDIYSGIISFFSLSRAPSPAARIVLEIRIPRLILAVMAGGSLAVSGSVFQTVLGNPLADPYILGVSGGAAVGAVISFILPGGHLSGATLPLLAFSGAIFASFSVFALSGVSGKRSRGRLILTGVIIAAFMNALILLLISLSPPGKIPGALFWLMGDLSGATPRSVRFLFPFALVLTGMILLLSRGLDVMLLGDESAQKSGLNVERFKAWIFVIASVLTGSVVALSGLIGFVGLIIPHIVRKYTGSLHIKVIPGSFLLGSAFLLMSDIISRSSMGTGTIPIGAVTAIIGAPFFIAILRKRI